ncbi:hypothetical protein BS47DRAFT_1007382 [Hydnum rufescens UP504]|uniref:Ferritin-like domain-containing protein n=1 Tax=Hydnum rufescens UP504 TaxID=1448309 RepID=A0A9P6E1V1_9AGAM|nr:hypothetical protein BS47DRAFT_1007382 [Hydnum rufescens UP504]
MQINENTYYSTALNLYNASDFVAAGVPNWVRGRIEQILDHEQAHVDKLREILGPNAQETTCVFEWPYSNPFSFIVLSQILEGLNAGTLIKMLPLIQNKTLLPVLSNLIATESRHAAWIGSAAGKLMPWSGPWETPSTFGQYTTQLGVHTISCPTDNYVLPFQAVPDAHVCAILPRMHSHSRYSATIEFYDESGSPTTILRRIHGRSQHDVRPDRPWKSVRAFHPITTPPLATPLLVSRTFRPSSKAMYISWP